MSADLSCQVVEDQDTEIFVLEGSIPCPHFTDKETERSPPPHPRHEAVTCPRSGGQSSSGQHELMSHSAGSHHLRPESLLSPRGLASPPADSPRGSEKGSEYLSSSSQNSPSPHMFKPQKSLVKVLQLTTEHATLSS